jgi:aspartyl aminopeptidase
MNYKTFNAELLNYLDQSPSPFHAVSSLNTELLANGFTQLHERDSWELTPGKYFVTRNDSSLVAFVLGTHSLLNTGMRIVGAHTDSPCLKVKPNPENRVNGYLNIGVEVYGGVLLNPWFDRDLSLAGRVTYQAPDGALHSVNINFQRIIGTIPSLAIHLDRDANTERKINPQTDIPPLLMQADDTQTFSQLLIEQVKAEHPDIKIERIMAYELSFFDTNGATFSGFNREFIASARLDNLLSCYTAVKGLLEADANLKAPTAPSLRMSLCAWCLMPSIDNAPSVDLSLSQLTMRMACTPTMPTNMMQTTDRSSITAPSSR